MVKIKIKMYDAKDKLISSCGVQESNIYSDATKYELYDLFNQVLRGLSYIINDDEDCREEDN